MNRKLQRQIFIIILAVLGLSCAGLLWGSPLGYFEDTDQLKRVFYFEEYPEDPTLYENLEVYQPALEKFKTPYFYFTVLRL